MQERGHPRWAGCRGYGAFAAFEPFGQCEFALGLQRFGALFGDLAGNLLAALIERYDAALDMRFEMRQRDVVLARRGWGVANVRAGFFQLPVKRTDFLCDEIESGLHIFQMGPLGLDLLAAKLKHALQPGFEAFHGGSLFLYVRMTVPNRLRG